MDRLVFTLLLILVNLSYAQLPEEYVLLLRFKNQDDLYAGEQILRNYPDAVFIHDLKLLMAEKYYQMGNKERSVELIKSINPKALKLDYLSRYLKLWRELGLDKKTAVLNLPHLFVDYLKDVELTEEERIKVGEELIKRKQYKHALEVLSFIPQACHLLGKTYEKLRMYSEAMSVLKDCYIDDALLIRAKITFNLSKDEFMETLRLLERSLEYNQALFYAGRMSLYKGNFQEALQWFGMMENSYQKFFQMGLTYFVLSDYKNAIEAFENALRLASNQMETSESHFWLFKSYKEIEDFSKASYHLLRASKGSGFYSTVSKVLLGEPVVSKFMKVFLVDAEDTSTARTIRSIFQAGFPYYARLEAFKKIDRITPSDILAIQHFDNFLAIRLAVRKFGTNSEIYSLVAYPKPYKEFVEEASQKFNIDKNLIWAVMRQESLFDPEAISPSNAKGLMQLMDFTAREVSLKYRIPNQVFSPKENILMGTAYLREMLDLWNGDLIRAVASYNAGPNRVKSFIQHKDPYVFIETIPIAETRNYVKQVLNNYYIYQALD
ncbi:transglycosylase SLT domain-containing protein [Thermocrinis sp.]|uniref:lytic transglycosylase domain-containing protein n=1 Tax=Thermocrinis sp. TaxID=2024383 RepID=UPI002FDE8837